MEVLAILQNQASELINEELDLLEEEVVAGEYDLAYRNDCLSLISAIRKQRDVLQKRKMSQDEIETDSFSAIIHDPKQLSPFGIVPTPKHSLLETIAHDLSAIRKRADRKSQFKAYVSSINEIDESFCDKHFDLFDDDEWTQMLSFATFSEGFLDKYFSLLDHNAIARYQRFSEKFFIKHYSDLDTTIVLNSGRNEWRQPDAMSNELKVFLKLKGAQL